MEVLVAVECRTLGVRSYNVYMHVYAIHVHVHVRVMNLYV